MSNDDFYGLNETSPLRSIYSRGSRSIYVPRASAPSNVIPEQQQQQQEQRQQNRMQRQRQNNDAVERETRTSVDILERHLTALQDIDRRLLVLSEHDSLLQTKVRSQEMQLEQLQRSMRTLIDQNNRSTFLMQQQQYAQPYQQQQQQQQQKQVVPSTAVLEHSSSGKNASNAASGSTNSQILIFVGATVAVLLVVIVALMVARWQKQKHSEKEVRKQSEMQQQVQRAVYDVLSQSQSAPQRNTLLSNNNNGRGTLAQSFSVPVAFGPQEY